MKPFPLREPISVVLIWSKEHKAWWLPDACGYTISRDEAGRYWSHDAQERTKHCDPEKQIVFHLASLPEIIVE